MASETRMGLPVGQAARGVAAARGRGRRARVRPTPKGSGLRVVSLYIDGVPRLRVYVAAGGMVDVAIRELEARLIEVEPLTDGPLPLAAFPEEAEEF